MGEQNTHRVNVFGERPLPARSRAVGYAALIDRFDLRVPLPRPMSAVAEQRHQVSTDEWVLIEPRQDPGNTLQDHLEFALRREGVRLSVLNQLFQTVPERDIVEIVLAKPTGRHTRRLWFLYEWLTGRRLDVPDAGKVGAAPALDPGIQFAIDNGEISTRHRVLNNLPGTPSFCPLVYKTDVVEAFLKQNLPARARQEIGRVHPDIMARAAAFLLLGDSRSSFQIEGEAPSNQRARRWAQAIGEAGSVRLSVPELERLQQIVIGDARFVQLGLRRDGGFIGQHDRATGEPIPEHISARPQDLEDLLDGLIAYADRSLAGGIEPVVTAAAVAFGFVFIHPFADGNGRLHRWLIHHLLARADYNPPGIVFPISSAILRRIDAYKSVLGDFSKPLLRFIEWLPTTDNNVDVTSETADYYRFFDATGPAEFLLACVEQTITHDLPDETTFLQRYDHFASSVQRMLEMPDRTVNLLHRFLQQNGGTLSRRAREREFERLSDSEVEQIEHLYATQFLDA